MTAAITVSERAARRIGQILSKEGEGAKLRISVEGGGCSGFQYKFDWSIRPRCLSWPGPRSISSTT